MHPAWLNPIEPRTFDRQLRNDDLHATLSFGFTVMLLDPVPDPAREVPGGIVPDQQPRLFAEQLLGYPPPLPSAIFRSRLQSLEVNCTRIKGRLHQKADGSCFRAHYKIRTFA